MKLHKCSFSLLDKQHQECKRHEERMTRGTKVIRRRAREQQRRKGEIPTAIDLHQGWQGGLIRLKKAGLNRMDKTGFFQMIFEKIRFKARWAPEKALKSLAEIFFCNLF